jgi:hypothetical protein
MPQNQIEERSPFSDRGNFYQIQDFDIKLIQIEKPSFLKQNVTVTKLFNRAKRILPRTHRCLVKEAASLP